VTSSHRVTVYVDGFNLYYGLLKANPAVKWLDLAALSVALRPQAVTTVRFFTAKVRPVPDPGSRARQRMYLKALATRPRVTIHYGHFRTHDVPMALVQRSSGGPATVHVWKTEEKGSDVNLATYLLLDGQDHQYDEAIIISGDSDLVLPVQEANRRYGPVHVLNPRNAHSDFARVAASYGPLDPMLLSKCQLPNVVTLATGATITRPAAYR
jgi:uncharacterized LabA/DUF88 family protein